VLAYFNEVVKFAELQHNSFRFLETSAFLLHLKISEF
jgi:hypothetical protein